MMINLLLQDPITYLMAAISILFAFTIHEYAHAQAIDILGDKTPRMVGRLSLNPLKHIDPIGMFFILIIGFGWGKPVPFNPLNLKDKKKGPMLIALAGPLSNLFLALFMALIIRVFNIGNPGLLNFFLIFIQLNIVLCVFNLIPIPPLDGSHILFRFLKSHQLKTTLMRNPFASILIAVLLMQYILVPFVVRPLYGLMVVGFPAF